MKTVIYNSPNQLSVGGFLPIRVNLSVGTEKSSSQLREKTKIKSLLSNKHNLPDMIMDLSISPNESELWEFFRDYFDGPIGVIPHYLLMQKSDPITHQEILNRIEFLFKNGINFITLHCTPNIKTLNQAIKKRATPITSRGGSLVIKEMLISNRDNSIFDEIFYEICHIASHYKGVINLGTTFRSSSVAQGLDCIHLEEIALQSKYIKIAREINTPIILEGPGHIKISEINNYWDAIKKYECPPMPLGPIVSDIHPEFDHISAAIGATHLLNLSKGGIINAITSIEHLGGVPSLKILTEGLMTAKLAAQSISLTYDSTCLEKEKMIAYTRGEIKSCVSDSIKSGCTRCGSLCPLTSEWKQG